MSPYQALEKSLGFSQALPVTENWSAAADFLKIISDYCLQNKPKIIVECSSGTSSVVLAQCCKLNELGHIYSLENGEEFVLKTQSYLVERQLNEYNDIIYAPLKEYLFDGEKYQWYDLKGLSVDSIDMLVIDGPPGFIQKNSRYPALPLLHGLMAKNCTVLLDDAAREDEQEVVNHWLEQYPEFNSKYIDSKRGCVILTR